MLYDLLKRCVSIFFNLLNKLMGGKLPPFGSACAVVEENGHYLVVELPGKRVVFPGGFMNWRESPQQTAQREGKEETGLELAVGDLINHYSCASDHVTNMSTLSFAYSAKVVGGALRKNMEGQPLWLTEKELRMRLRGHSRLVLEDYLRYRNSKQEKIALLAKVKTLTFVS
ncbi:NUDIX hydrolase [Ktedonosporobacter rubrisoli]|uniref:NUDIX hydrolase n=1 Tax=Ktedonosporobacter rubrisoli TaxID=2509675 RepID=A0A4P6JV67_KTERU|nr:NUDIX hydrolase [Ktedonosporobacter rubrisoli]QBD79253.1 NUDIX hydrolase [Ktedonosporobacter rubrisoli]